MENKDMEQPRMVSSHDIRIDTEYADYKYLSINALKNFNDPLKKIQMKNSTNLVENFRCLLLLCRGDSILHPHLGCFAFAGTVERANGIVAKGTPRNQMSDE